jgi:hypothetical protein
MSRSGSVKVKVTCPFEARGRLTLEKGKRLGRKSFSIRRANKAKTVKVKLSRKGRRAVKRRKRLRVTASVVATRRGVVGASARSTTKRGISIRAPARKRSGGKR